MKGKLWKGLLVVSAVAGSGIVTLVGYTVVSYLYTSPRFEVKRLSVVRTQTRGAERRCLLKSVSKIRTNVFSVDLEQLRLRVEGLQWVRFAHSATRSSRHDLRSRSSSVSLSAWPESAATFTSSMHEAELLDQDRGAGVHFPILDGLKIDDAESNQKKIDLYRRVMDELHGQNELSEIHINDEGEVSVVSLSDPLLVNLGVGSIQGPVGTLPPAENTDSKGVSRHGPGGFPFQESGDRQGQAGRRLMNEKMVWDAEKRTL